MPTPPSTFTTNKTFEQPANGAYSNTWDSPVNADWAAIDCLLYTSDAADE